MKPFSEACEQNKEPILAVLREIFPLQNQQSVLEIGSGTGQHAVFFAKQLPHLNWQTSDLAHNHAGIHAWLAEEKLTNVLPPLLIDAKDTSWPVQKNSFDAVFSANAVHIMSWPEVVGMFVGIGNALKASNATLCLYGPFNYGGKFTSESNAYFDQCLKQNDPNSGVRDFEALDGLASKCGLKLSNDFAMPANNRTLVWRR